MKKIKFNWNFTLSKKIFFCILLSFLLLENVHYRMDVDNKVEAAYNTLNVDEEGLNIIAKDFYQNYKSIDDPQFLQLLKEKDEIIDVVLFDNEKNIVDKKTYMGSEYDIPKLTFYEKGEKETLYIASLEGVDEERLSGYQHWVEGMPTSEHSYIKIAYNKEVDKTDEDTLDTGEIPIKEVSDITYLELDGLEIIKGDKTKAIGFPFWGYERDSFSTGRSILNRDDTVAVDYVEAARTAFYGCMDFRMEPDRISVNKINHVAKGLTSMDSYNQNFSRDGMLYSTVVFPLVEKDVYIDEEGYVAEADVKGYILTYQLSPKGIDDLSNETFNEKLPIYFLSFIFSLIVSLILSYLLTKRLKAVNRAALQIANNDFNVYLEERPYDELGELSTSINVMNNQLKETMGQLTDEIEHVKKLESVRKEFIANFTHEIKTPLGIINGYIELIQDIKNEDKKSKYLKAINKETDHINELVLAMLDLTRLESSNVELNIQEIDIEDLMTNGLDSFASLLEKKQIKVSLDGHSDWIYADLFEIQIVIRNLLSNAIKHTPQFGTLFIHLYNHQVSIENEGSHLTDLQMERIWDTYVSGDRDGTGLGLAICKRILDLHGFKYGVENTDRGVRFTFETSKEMS